MRVLIVSQYFWPENFRINDLARELVRRGHNLTVLTGIPNYPAGKIFEAFKRNRAAFDHYDGASIYRVPMLVRGSGNLRLLLNYLSFVVGACIFGSWKLRKQEFDVIFVFEPSPVTVGLPAVLLGRLKHAPVVFWVQDLWPETLAAVGVLRSPRLLAVVGMLVRFIYNRCSLVLGQSHGFMGNIAQYCVDTKKIRCFPNWAEEIFCFADIVPAPEIPIREGAFNILFAGNVGEAQDFPTILDAAESLKHNTTIRWLIVGDGRMTDWLRAEVAKRNLEHCFLLLGRFPLARMPSFFSHADALLVSLKRDPVFALTIPAKVQSYLLAGIPLLGMLDGDGADVIRNANAGLVCPAGNSQQLAQAVLDLTVMSKDERQQLGANGRTYAQKEFNRELLMSKLENWFVELTNDTTRQ